MPELSLTDFLLARIADDENGTQPGTIQNGVFSGIMQHYGMDEADDTDQEQASEIADAIMSYLRPRVLAECEAKRHIVEGLALAEATGYRPGTWLEVCELLAAVYADSPDFDPSWRVE
jgi:hypothetical protein